MLKRGHLGLTLFVVTCVLSLGLLVYTPINLYGAEASPDGVTGASKKVEPLEHYEPLPVKHAEREVNNVLLGSGLGVAALLIGGAVGMDKRNNKQTK